jgi:TrbL/VirB6 plasmid conjugal transfer protein
VRSVSAQWRIRQLIRTLVCVIALALGGAVIPLSSAMASPAGGSSGSGTEVQNNCKKFQGLVNRFGSCIKETILKTAVKYFDKMYSYFLTALNLFLTFGIIIYGVMLTTGSLVDDVKRDSMVVLLKVGFVVFFAGNLEMIYFWVINMMDGLIDLYFQFSSSMDEGKCSDAGEGYGPFKRLDCLLDLVVGLKSSSYQGSTSGKISGDGVGRGFINFFFKAGISSGIGMMIAGVGFFIVYTLVFTVIKITFMYLMAIISISFLVMLGPIFIPLVMFNRTKEYFDPWVKLIVSFALQPVIMFAYVAMMIIAFDKAVFSGSNSLMSAIVGPEASGSDFNLNQWMQDKGVIKRDGYGFKAKADDATKDKTGTRSTGESTSPGMIMRDLEGSGGYDKPDTSTKVKTFAQHVPINMIDWKKLAEARGKSEKDLMKEILYAIIFVALVVYVFTTMLDYIPSMGADLGGTRNVNLNDMVGKNPLEGAGKNFTGNITQGIKGLMGAGGKGKT